MSELWTAWLAYSIGVYAIISCTALIGWRRNLLPAHDAELPIHIFVPAHNEASVIGGLLEDLERQTFPKANFKIIVVDDRSTDATPDVIERYRPRLPIQCMRIDKLPANVHGKLHAMHLATSGLSNGSVLFVDADCRVGPRWLETMAKHCGPGGCAGPVFELPRKKSLWREVLSLDQAAVTYPAMGLLARMIPFTASTANMLLPVQAFRNGLWDRVGTEGTGEDGRILQAQASVG
ncbi:MAG: glycosyltransferase, partial [bacterium]|nr:glycosyltransferase [bacterium]